MTTRSWRNAREKQAGYVLLTLLLVVTLLVIAAAAAAPKIAFVIKRDQEQELIHRGVQYTRAIRAFTRKFGRYPSSLDELQNTNGQRFLRKRYKDPITGQEFKLLHLADVQLSGGPGVGALTQGSQRSLQEGGNPGATGMPAPGALPAPAQDPNTPADQNTNQDSMGQTSPGQTSLGQNNLGTAASKLDALSPSGDSTGTTKFGGGPIVGVASPSKQRSIREFAHKNHYNDWQFYYDPGYDRGFLINGPTVKMTISNTALSPGETPDSNQQQPSQSPQPQPPEPK